MDKPASGMAEACAHADFRRARRGHLTARAWRRLRRTRPRDLADAVSLHWQATRRRVIPLAAIVGTVETTADFDASFRPARERVASRWLSIARAHHDGRPLPPINVIELPDGYYVVDGRHRVSVARALGHAEIEAWASRGYARSMASTPTDHRALRAPAGGEIDTESLAAKARELGVMGWVRPTGEIHAEGAPEALQALLAFVGDIAATEDARVEGHEQFGIRGVSAGAFVVQEHQANAHHYELRLQVDGVMRSWAVPKGPSLDPAAKRLAVEAEDHGLDENDFEGTVGGGGVIVWDRGTYEQGGRVAWPEALERGHAVFVLHGEKLRGGFALQRTRPGTKPQWLFVKRRDDEARPGSDIVAERTGSVVSGRTLSELRG
jgi:DNA ligase D-like protein (predicted 3'-phosphoesterase)